MLETAGGSTSATVGEAAIPASPAPHVVHLPCPCPGHPHPFDVVTLRRHASLAMGAAVRVVLRDGMGDGPRIEAGLAREFTRWGIEAWTFTDTLDDSPVPVYVGEPVERETLERWLPWWEGGLPVIEAASALYYEDCVRPFRSRPSTRSPDGPAEDSTSATNGSGPKPPKRSRQSSPAAIDGPPSEDPAP